MGLFSGAMNTAATGIGGAVTALSDVMGTAIQGAGGILKFGLKHPILSGIAGVIAYKGISGAFNAKSGESIGVAAAKGIGDLFGSVKNYTGAVLGGAKDMAMDLGEKAQDFYSNKIDYVDGQGKEIAKVSYADPDRTVANSLDADNVYDKESSTTIQCDSYSV